MNQSELRNSISGRLLQLNDPPDEPWYESKVPYSAFGRIANPESTISFAVGILGSEPVDDRQQARDGMWMHTRIGIKIGFRIPPQRPVVYEDLAWLAVDKAISKLLEQQDTPPIYPGDFNPHFESVTGDVVASGEWFIGDIRFTVGHLFPINSSIGIL